MLTGPVSFSRSVSWPLPIMNFLLWSSSSSLSSTNLLCSFSISLSTLLYVDPVLFTELVLESLSIFCIIKLFGLLPWWLVGALSLVGLDDLIFTLLDFGLYFLFLVSTCFFTCAILGDRALPTSGYHRLFLGSCASSSASDLSSTSSSMLASSE